MKQSLYSIANEYLSAYTALYGSEDFSEECVKDTLEGIEGEFKQKALNVGAMIKNMEADSKAIKEAEEGMRDRRKALEGKIKSMRDYLFDNICASGVGKICSPQMDIGLRKCPPSVQIEDGAFIPDDLMRIVPETMEPDKIKIKDYLITGGELNGISLVQKQTLLIS